MKLLLYSITYPGPGGVQRVFGDLAEHLRQQGHQVVKAWATRSPDIDCGDLTIPLPFPQMGGMAGARSAWWSARCLLNLARQLDRLRPQVVNIHFITREAGFFLLLRPLFGYKVVLSAHGSDMLRPEAHNASYLPGLLRRADAITAVSQPVAEQVMQLRSRRWRPAAFDESPASGLAKPAVGRPPRLRLIPNGIDFGYWSAEAAEEAGRRAPVIATVGRMVPVKGLDVLLSAFRLLRQRCPASAGARLVMVGDGPLRAELEQQSRALGLAGVVDFLGSFSPDAVRTQLSNARVFALPSRSEGMPLSLLEAMAAGTAVVASAVGGVPQVLTPGTGLLIPPEDPSTLADALAQLLSDSQLSSRLGRAGRRRAAAFSNRTTHEAYERLFEEVANGKW